MKTTIIMMLLLVTSCLMAQGSIDIATKVSGADVYIDGRFVGKTPLVVTGISMGNHSLRIQGVSGREYTRTLLIQDEFTTSLNINLLEEEYLSQQIPQAALQQAPQPAPQPVDTRTKQKERNRVRIRNSVLGAALINEFAHGSSEKSKDKKRSGRTILGGVGVLNELFNR